MNPLLTHQLAGERQRDLMTEAARARSTAPARRRACRAVLAAVLPTALAAAVLPSAAQAGTVSLSGSTLLYVDESAAGEQNNVTIRSVNGKIVIADTAVVRSNTSQCKVFNGDLECASASQVQVSLGAGFDRMEYRAPVSGVVQLGSGNDSVVAGVRETAGQAIQPVIYLGESGFDLIGYDKATSGVVVDMADGVANDGRPGDRENIAGGFEHVNGSSFRDTLFGTPGPDGIAGGLERDIIAGGGGDDFFYSAVKDGADDYHGGPGSDSIEYFGRTLPLTVQLDNTANDGEAGEADNVRSNVENVFGGSGADTLSSFSAFSRLEGRGSADRLNGGDGPDTLVGGPGGDSLEAGAGNDVVDARDGEPDFVDCGTEADTLSRDTGEGTVKGCESVQVGVLRLTPEAVRTEAGKPARLVLSWRHPQSWRKLRTVALRVTQDGLPVGEVTINPRNGRMTDKGAVRLVRRASRIAHDGKTASARLAVRVDPSLAGRRLRLEVEATDVRGRRQLERNAGSIRVAK